jgi:N-acetyl-anhydromuramyl-L-alanine amidase AmpD
VTALVAALLAFSPPAIHQWRIPFPQQRKDEMRAYARRHYGINAYRLTNPKVIVEHVAVASTAAATRATFVPDRRDPELHELPGTCSHFVVDRDGSIYQLVSLKLMCRHTVGLNYTAIGIEHAGFKDSDVLANRRELAASLRLTEWLKCRYRIRLSNVIGHNESLSSPYHRERIARLRNQTHGDMQHASMRIYRRKLRVFGC